MQILYDKGKVHRDPLRFPKLRREQFSVYHLVAQKRGADETAPSDQGAEIPPGAARRVRRDFHGEGPSGKSDEDRQRGTAQRHRRALQKLHVSGPELSQVRPVPSGPACRRYFAVVTSRTFFMSSQLGPSQG